MNTSCGWPCRYVLICSWNVLWSTVLTLTFVPVFAVKALNTFAYAFFGTGSDAFEPKVTVPAAADLKIEDEKLRAEAPPAERP